MQGRGNRISYWEPQSPGRALGQALSDLGLQPASGDKGKRAGLQTVRHEAPRHQVCL